MMRRARAKQGEERGAVLVETVLTLPIFFLLIFAIIEFGFVFRDFTTINNATSDAVRGLSIRGDDIDADHHALQVLAESAIALPDGAIETIVIYSAATPSTPVPPQCLTGSVAGLCNTYTEADQLRDVAEFGCLSTTALDGFYCPTTRDTSQATASFVGIHVVGNRQLLTGFFGDSRAIRSTDVLRVEPRDR